MRPASTRRKDPRGQGPRLRAELITAARRLAETAGTTEGLSLRAVAREVGVAPNSVYLHLRDREEIFRAAVAEDCGRLADRLQVVQAPDDPFENIRHVARAYCAFATEHPASYRLITQVVQAVLRVARDRKDIRLRRCSGCSSTRSNGASMPEL